MKKYLGILFALVLAVSLILIPASGALAISYVDAGDPVIKLNGDASGGQTFYVGETIAITGDAQPYAEMSDGQWNEAYTNAKLFVIGPSGPDTVFAHKGDWGGYGYRAVVNIPYSFTITYTLTAPGTHTVDMCSYANAVSEEPDVCVRDWGYGLLTFEVVPPVKVEIDIKPGSDPNSINLKDQGVLPVAILGSSIDVDTIDVDTITLGGTAVTSRGSAKAPKLAVSFEDVDGDFITDLVAFFRVQELIESGALDIDTTKLKLEAETTGGVPICGIDGVRVVPE